MNHNNSHTLTIIALKIKRFLKSEQPMIKIDCDNKISIFGKKDSEKTGEKPCVDISHKGSVSCGMYKLAAIAGLVALTLSFISCFCGMMAIVKFKKRF